MAVLSRRRLLFTLIAVGALVNLGAGVVLALRDPRRGSDLWTVYGWCRDWLFTGRRLYTEPDAICNYPPGAIVMLSPLAVLPAAWVGPIWTLLSLLLAPAAAWAVVRTVTADRRTAIVPCLLFLCWSSTRTLLQFSVLSMTLGFLAMPLADTRWIASGLLLGLALFKPHIAGPIALWTLVTGRLRVTAVAAAVVIAGLFVFDVRIGESPLSTIRGFLWVLGDQYGGGDPLVGPTSVRAWVVAAMRNGAAAERVWLAGSALSLAVFVVFARRLARAAGDAAALAIVGLFSLWSLTALYHNSNNLVLLLPLFALLWYRDDRVMPALVLTGALTVETWARRLVPEFDRVVVLAALAYLIVRWYLSPRTRYTPVAAAGAS